MVQVVALVDVQFAPNPVKDWPVPGVAVSVTTLFPAKVATHVVGQLMRAGLLVTVPVPVAVMVSEAAPVPDSPTVCMLPAVGPLSVMVTVPV
jgi:hypothetical protein